MKKIILFVFALSPVLLYAQLVKQLRKTITLQMPKTENSENPGKRGASVVWHPVQKKYYVSFAGNGTYPMAVFDVTGKLLSDTNQTALVDVRGLWYNQKRKKICGNGYNETGWFEYTLDAKGMIEGNEVFHEGLNQPGEQSVGAYNPKTDKVYFLSAQKIVTYGADGMEEADSTIILYPGIGKKENIEDDFDAEDEISEDYNYTTLIFTGIPKAEFGLLNNIENQVELYNRQTGLMTQKLKIPVNTDTYSSFNFSYTNGIFWLFNMDTRIWTGYK